MVPLYVLNETCRWINQWTCLYSFCFTFFHDQNNTYVAFVVTLIRIASNSFTCLYSFSQMARKHLSEFSWLNTEHRCSFVNLGFMILAIEVQKLPILIFCSVYLEGLSDIRWIYSCRRAARNKQKGIHHSPSLLRVCAATSNSTCLTYLYGSACKFIWFCSDLESFFELPFDIIS